MTHSILTDYKGGCLACGAKDLPVEPYIFTSYFAATRDFTIPEDIPLVNNPNYSIGGVPFCGSRGKNCGVLFFNPFTVDQFYDKVREFLGLKVGALKANMVAFPNGTNGFVCMSCKEPCPYVETINRPNIQYECGSCRVTFG